MTTGATPPPGMLAVLGCKSEKKLLLLFFFFFFRFEGRE